MKVKDGRSARPRFHVYFIIPEITDSKEYTLLKKRIAAYFPYFDSNALDSARLLFGSADPQVEIYEGSSNIIDFIDDGITVGNAPLYGDVSQGSKMGRPLVMQKQFKKLNYKRQ